MDSIAHRSFADADELHQMGTTLFTIGLSGPDYDLAIVTHWLAWRDHKNT